MHILKGRRHILWENLVLSCFMLCLFSRCFMVFWVIFSIYTLLLSAHRVYVLDVHISLLVCFIDCMFGWSFALLCDYYGHFHMTVLCLIKLLVCFISYLLDRILLVLLSLDLPWGSNAFCASVSGYRYICYKFITTSRFRCEWVLPLFPNSLLSLEFVLEYFVMK